MADILGKDPATYSREKEAFLRDLKHFHDTRGTPFRRCPTLGGREIDLFLLYTLVTQEGGWIKVNAKNDWTTFFPHFKLPAVCSNGCVALKQIYLRYLDRWEKVHFLGEDGDRGSDDDEENRHKRWSARALNSVPHSYLYSQHNVSDEKREQFHLDSNLYKASDYDRLALSLISPLPNEQDFAINVCTLLSNDNRHNLKLDKHPRIVTFLLAHAGIFNHSSLRQLFVHIYSDVRKKPIHNFWSDVLESDEFLDLTNENNFYTRKEDEKPCDTLIKDDTLKYALLDSSEKGGKRSESRESDIECELVEDSLKPPKYFRFKSDPSDRELFCLRRTLGTQDYVGQRVLQVATILRNLCFMEDNVSVLTKNSTFLRFLLLCSCSQWGTLRNLGLDMLGNIAADFDLNGQNDLLGTSLLKVISKNLQSDDRACCLSSVEVLNKLSQNERNEDVLIRSLESTVYKRVCSFLTIHDVMLLIYTLECLYSLSSLGERSCNFIGNIHGVIDTLVSLVTVEGKSYGPKACIGMKLVETIPPGSHLQSQTQQQTNNQTNNQQTSPQQGNSATATTSSMDSGNIVSSPPPPSVTPVKVMTTMSNTPIRNVTIAPQRLLSSPAKTDQTTTPLKTAVVATPTVTTTTPVVSASSVIPSMSPQMLIQQQHAHQQAIQENEQFALAWLRATYEPCTGSNKIDHQELYKHYISSCSKIGRRGVISPLHFPRCVRSVFGGTVGPNPMKPANPSDPQYYEGIKAISHPHLSHALLGSTASTSGTTTTTTAVLAKNETGTTQGGQNNSSSLIKSLLANKVNDACVPPVSMKAATTTTDCQNVAQVAARQKLLSQQNTANDSNQRNPSRLEALKMHRINGVRQLFAEKEINDPSVSSTTQFVSSIKGKKEPPQPPPPPLAPLSNNTKSKSVTLVNEDSDSLSSTSCLGAVGIVSSTEDNDNSLTSFEGLLNGMPIVEETLNDSSNSKDSVKTSSNEISIDKPLRLADLLEKKFDTKGPALLNGTLNKDLKLSSEKSDLLENHIEKALSRDNVDIKMEVEEVIKEEVIDIKEEVLDEEEVDSKQGIKRQATDEISGIEAKKAHLLTNVNGSTGSSELSSANGDDRPTTVSNAAAKLFADFAADILEDEDDDVIIQETTTPANQPQPVAEPAIQQQQQQQQLIVDNNQQMLLSQSRQMIVSQPTVHTSQSVVLSSGTQLKTTSGQTVIVQNAGMQPRQSVLIQPANSGQLLLSQGLQGQVQLVQSAQSGQYVIQTNSSQGYVVAQPQTAMVHGQPQTVLLTQQGQAVGSKTIIILQQQASGSASHHQKVMVTPQGQQVVVTQVPRPVAQASTVSCNNIQQTKTTRPTPSPSPALSTTSTSSSMSNGVKEKSEEPVKKVVRDVTSLYICEWDDCQINTKFKSANQVYLHACESHCPKGDEEVYCLWDRCDSLKRKRFSLMTHINDKHCNLEAMKHSLVRRKKIAQGLTVEPPPPSPSSHPGYAPDAALHAIKRHALEFVNPKELQIKTTKQGATTTIKVQLPPSDQDDNEGPVTKSIRLTASLILRNLVIYSNTSKRYLRSYESHLANIALSNVESSRTIAQILYDINDRSTHR
ncbi:AT-rich interactive domain-containing protein 2 isoform X5 [Anthonomus grandis grandis]|uniref:AT-rich interactive domain-containing protein 2 isoform X5 n=1 Tax=Anthonomus grandis grandis TaxID=2921223 RepID=UPI002165EDBE|nr:AT-rich interactive domain-containing protein 2 isoform X5 [Anthonomus grandis grandis]